MHRGYTLRALVRPDGRYDRSHAGSDILPHDDWNRRAVGYGAGHAERLQDTD